MNAAKELLMQAIEDVCAQRRAMVPALDAARAEHDRLVQQAARHDNKIRELQDAVTLIVRAEREEAIEAQIAKAQADALAAQVEG